MVMLVGIGIVDLMSDLSMEEDVGECWGMDDGLEDVRRDQRHFSQSVKTAPKDKSHCSIVKEKRDSC